ncbi:MAG TPA: T9SS type A sorting domain-containing protein [Chryseolinea sp.]|nr:T9SS type A sorting domain-containing protein [Chryseolinea sp.]
MKKVFTVLLGLLLAFQVAEAHKKKKGPSCDSDSFSTEVVKEERISETCVRYEIKVSYDGTKTYGLSHYSIGIPCGEIKDATNSKRWKMVFGKDRTTGVYGLKVDDIKGFGERGKDSFTVKFTWCSSGSCDKKLGVVAYKAGQCVDYDTLSNPGNNPDSTQNCSALRASLQKKNVTCPGQSDGELKVIIEEGQAPFVYTWSNGSKLDVVQDLSVGMYAVTVKDAKGNVLTLRGEVVAPPPIMINEAVTNPSCSGQYNGSIALAVTGGTGEYSFGWSTGSSEQNLSDLPSGFYTVTVTDSIGCSAVKAMMLTNGTLISAESTLSHPTCTQSNGSIDLTPIGGTAPYTYEWSNGATTQDLENVAAGTYVVTIADAGGCYTYKIYTLEVRSTIAIQFVVNPATCAGDNSGAIDVTISGGAAPYAIQWLDGAVTEDRSALSPGAYQISVTDALGCTATSDIFVNKKTLQIISEVLQPSCAQGLGSITVTPIGGNGPYTYEWSNGQTGSTIDNLPDGNYTVNITDAAGCNEFQSFFITAPASLTVSGTISNAQCGATGAFEIDLSATGGKSPYTYLWSTGATSQDVSGLTAGIYTVDVKDGGGCTTRKQFVIDPASLSWSCLIAPPATSAVCGSVGNALNTVVTGATSYQWTVTSTDSNWMITSGAGDSLVVYTAGNAGSSATFTLTVVKNGCTQTCSYTVTGGCVVRDNTGGGDPSSGEPCTTTPTTPPVDPTPEPEPPTEEPERGCKGGVIITAYPNPFHDRVKLEWTASANERVKLEIYDMRGNRVKVLYEGNVSKGQRYSFEWSASNCGDPFYYYRLTSSKNVTHGKLVRKR